MFCYKDQSFCVATECTNKECSRYFSDAVLEGAKAWGGEDAPIAFSDFRETCDKYKPETENE